jgi:hypothetical protein
MDSGIEHLSCEVQVKEQMRYIVAPIKDITRKDI